MAEDVDTAATAALIANPARAAMLDALFDGGERTAGALAKLAGVAPSTASMHLVLLERGGLIVVERHGRERRVRLAGPEVAHALEALSAIAPPRRTTSLSGSERARALRAARTCYDHLAGALGVALTDALCGLRWLRRDDLSVTRRGDRGLTHFGIDVAALAGRSRPLTRACLDWSERRHHLGGALGAGLCTEILARGWVERMHEPRALRLTADGAQGLAESFGLTMSH